MDPRPIDSYRDIHPWPYEWSSDFALSVLRFLDELNDTQFFLDPWTYMNHWRVVPVQYEDAHRYVVDFFQGGTLYTRAFLPLDRGDELADVLVSGWGPQIDAVLWNHYIWTPAQLWREWTGPQGDFVEHVHLEFNRDALRDRYEELVIDPTIR